MSRIYWHTRDQGTAELLGSERAYMGQLVSQLSTTFLPHHVCLETEPWLAQRISRRFFKPFTYEGKTDHYLDREALALNMRTGSDKEIALFDEKGSSLESFSLMLNTILQIGNDPLAVMARLHGQCELHLYVEGEHRAWLADLIDEGQELRVMRPKMGWEALSAFLRAADDAPVVTSYSVTDGFPEGMLDVWDDESDEPEPEYDHERDWDIAMGRLREQGFELNPTSLRKPFMHKRHLLDLFD